MSIPNWVYQFTPRVPSSVPLTWQQLDNSWKAVDERVNYTINLANTINTSGSTALAAMNAAQAAAGVAQSASDSAGQSALDAAQSASNAAQSETSASQSKSAAQAASDSATQSAADAAQSAVTAEQSASNAAQSVSAAQSSAADAGQSATSAAQSAADAAQSKSAASLTPAAGKIPLATGAAKIHNGWIDLVPISAGGTGARTAKAARTALGLGTAATRNTGEGITKTGDLAIEEGFTPSNPKALAVDDLNTITVAGFYYQFANNNALPERNYPVARAGALVVLKNSNLGTNAAGITQIYVSIFGGNMYHRGTSDGVTWTNWVKHFDSGNQLDIGKTDKTAREALNLGTTATRNVGIENGDVLEVGAGGWLGGAKNLGSGASGQEAAFRDGNLPSCFAAAGASALLGYPLYIALHGPATGVSSRIALPINQDRLVIHRQYNGTWSNFEMYHNKNTTRGADGTLKAASPIIRLSREGITVENPHEFGGVPEFERLSKGVYKITGTLGLRVSDWYIDQPRNRNNELYHNLDWDQDTILPTDNGIISADDAHPVTLVIRTYERQWNAQTGTHENGEPVDIKEGREVVLRFNEIEQPAPEDTGEPAQPVEPSEPTQPQVPQVLSMRQAQLYLNSMDMLDDIEEMIADSGDRAFQIEWATASKIERHNPYVNLGAEMLGFTPKDVDGMFIEAAQL